MSTFEDLIARVDQTNSALVSIRETIIDESIDSTLSILDAIQSYSGGVSSSSSDKLQQQEMQLEKDREDLEQLSFMESMVNYLAGIYQNTTKLVQAQGPDLFDFATAGVAGYVGGEIADGDDKEKDGKSLKDRFSGFLKRLFQLVAAAFVSNELLRFFFDKGLADLPKLLSDYFTTKFDEMTRVDFDIGKVLNDGLDTAFRLIFGEGTLESSLKQAGLMAGIGFLIAGPMGALILGVSGLVLGAINAEDVIDIKNDFIDAVANWSALSIELLNEGILEALSNTNFKQLAEDARAAAAGGTLDTESALDDAAVLFGTFAEDAEETGNKVGDKVRVQVQALEEIQKKIVTKQQAIKTYEQVYIQGGMEREQQAFQRFIADGNTANEWMGSAERGLYTNQLTQQRATLRDIQEELANLRAKEAAAITSIQNSTDASQNVKQSIQAVPTVQTAKRNNR